MFCKERKPQPTYCNLTINLIKKKKIIKDYFCYIRGEQWTEGGSSSCLMGALNATGHFPSPTLPRCSVPGRKKGETWHRQTTREEVAKSEMRRLAGLVRRCRNITSLFDNLDCVVFMRTEERKECRQQEG